MDRLRTPFLVAAIVLAFVVVLVELGIGLAPGLVRLLSAPTDGPPGIAIPAMALVDLPWAFTLLLFGLGVVVPHALLGRVQGLATLILAIVLLLAGIVAVFLALALLLLMLGLIASFFGIIVYLAVFGDFPRALAATILAFLMGMKLASGVCLVLAHQRFLQKKGLVLLFVTSLVANVVISFLHALVPSVLISVTDAVAAIIVAILGIIWAVLLLIGAVIAVVRVLQPGARKQRDLRLAGRAGGEVPSGPAGGMVTRPG